MAFIQHKADAHCVSVKSAVMIWSTVKRRRQRRQKCGTKTQKKKKNRTYFSIKDHLVSFPVLDLVVEIFGKFQTFVDLSFKSNCALSKK